MQGLTINSSGELQPVELYGPNCFDSWDGCYRVWRTGCIMLGTISMSCLDAYRDLLALYQTRYGKESWIIIYQADVRARLEHLERVRRRGQQELDAAHAAGGVHPFDCARPWEWSLRAVVEDTSFWRRELEEPAILVLARASKMASMVDGDVPVAAPGEGTAAVRPAGGQGHAPGGGQPRQRASAKARPVKQRLVDPQGTFTHNRKGVKLCKAFQNNQCDPAGAWNKCPRDASAVHQCAKCLSPTHGQAACSNPAGREPAFHRKGGKGKGKGDGKRRDQY